MNDKNLAPVLISGVYCYEESGVAYIRLEDAARGLGFTEIAASGNECVKWARVRKYLSDLGIDTSVDGKLPEYIPENIFYRLCMKANNETAQKFQTLVCDVILPTLRKTGSYSITPKMDSLQALNLLVKSLNEQQYAMNRLQVNVDAQSAAIEKLEEQNELNRQAFTMNSGNWRENATAVVGSIVLKKTGGEMKGSSPIYEEVWNEIYDMMKSDFHKDMKKRKMNLKKEFPKRKFSNLEVIDRAGDRNQLISVLQSVLCKMCIRYGIRLDMDKAKNLTNRNEDSQTSMFDRNCAPAGKLMDARESAARG